MHSDGQISTIIWVRSWNDVFAFLATLPKFKYNEALSNKKKSHLFSLQNVVKRDSLRLLEPLSIFAVSNVTIT